LRKQLLSTLCSGLLAIAACATAQADPPTEYEVKAAFIHNIAKFVEWPDKAASGPRELKLCILGKNPFGSAIETLHNKTIGTMRWEVATVSPKDDLSSCRVLYISASESANLEQLLNSTKGRAVLTIGDTEGYAVRGVIINFYMEGNKVRFEINAHAIKQARLNISAQLLNLARIVSAPGELR
jgi:hypothetical protein